MSTENPTWDDVKEWAEEQIERAFTELEKPGTDHVETEILRARIKAMRDLTELPNKQPEPAVPAVPVY